MTGRKRPALRYVTIAADGSTAWDAAAFRDPVGSVSYAELYENSPEIRKTVEDEMARRRASRARDNCHRFGPTSADAGATVQTTRRKSTFAGFR